jgi:hypothetical protein
VHRRRALAALIVAATAFGCLKGPSPTSIGANDVRFDLSAQVTGGSSLAITCGLTTGSVAYCWGYNAFGQVGNASTQNLVHADAGRRPAGSGRRHARRRRACREAAAGREVKGEGYGATTGTHVKPEK